MIMTDARTRFQWAFPAEKKPDIPSTLVRFVNHLKVRYARQIRVFFSDNDSEFRSTPLLFFFAENGIYVDGSASMTPEQNGVAGSANKSIVTRARSMLINSGLPVKFWEEAVEYCCYVTNIFDFDLDFFPRPFKRWGCCLKQRAF